MAAKRLDPEEKQRRLEQRRIAKETIAPVEVVNKEEEPKQSLFEKFTGSGQTKAPKKTRSKKVDPTIITKVFPLVVSTFAVSLIRQRMPEPYKVCAPTQEEVVNMVKPYFNILSRYVEITGRLSENTIDIISALLASLIYGTRAYVTYVQIQEYQNDRPDDTTRNESTTHAAVDRADSEKIARSIGDTSTQEQYAGNGNASDISNDSQLTRYESEIMDDLFKRDLEGRRRLGLL